MKISLVTVFALSVALNFCFGQSVDFMYKRKLETVSTEGWSSVALPADIFSKVNSDYSDLRVYQIGNDTLELPFLIRTKENEYSEEGVTLKELNKSKKDGKLFVTFELSKGQSVNYLNLSFEENNYNGFVTLEGSIDQQEWFEIIKDYRILSIHDQQVDFKATTLSFPQTNYRYIRAQIQTDLPTTFVSASFEKRSVVAGSFQTINHKINTNETKADKQTQFAITLDQYQPVNKIDFSFSHQQDYYRSFTIEALQDSAKTPKGWNYYYETLHSGYLTSLRENEFEFATTSTRQLRVTVYNADNLPITLSKLTVSGPRVEIILPLKPADNYFLFYGNKNVNSPSYDLVHFKDQIPTTFNPLGLLGEEVIGQKPETNSPLLENKMWLWLAMGLAVAVMGYFTLKMMKAKG